MSPLLSGPYGILRARVLGSTIVWLAWMGYLVVHGLYLWDSFGLVQNVLLIGASFFLASLLSKLSWGLGRHRAWTGALGAGERAFTGSPLRVARGFLARIAASVVIVVAWLVYVIVQAAFLWSGFSVGQNLALAAASLLVAAGLLAVMWISWGLRFARLALEGFGATSEAASGPMWEPPPPPREEPRRPW